MAKDRKAKPNPMIAVPVEESLREQLIEEARHEERSVSDTCRRLWREALAARAEARQLTTVK